MSSGSRIERARERLGMSQRALAGRAGLSQATLSRIESGERTPKMNEIVLIAAALGCAVSEISERSAVRDRVVCFARAENGSDMSGLRGELVHLLELDAYLDEYGIS
ncbi:helix-turn-helix domain-containing protein [Phytoactinopolyspora sp. XMNu-373]|uniref:Helix-turn-helix domain-containing protein n=2 Tax=Phytoactinopolyspora mesophila TaxID=2650750 RepID=A0A7K3M019_9ACTN|nr:helix-turn-helix transcriptional regulator [Phytoactinopolyspora mesophila]NDL56633.1 helix-turn-helix domain-containing protein [Phytoactinopolyspora mesophila]